MSNAIGNYSILRFNKTRDYMLEFAFISVGVMIPLFFHFYGLQGQVFLPMHWTVYCAGLIYGSRIGMFTGFTITIINHLVTGMPAAPVLPLITLELSAYGMISGILRKKTSLPNALIVIFSMISGRTVYLAAAILLKGFSQAWPFAVGIWKLGLISSVAQIILIPIIVKGLRGRM